MDRTERFFRIDRLLRSGSAVPLKRLVDELEVSPATVKRDLEYLRDRFDAPIVWDKDRRGYCLDRSPRNMRHYALPGLWFSARELHALLTMRRLLDGFTPGILGEHIEPIRDKLESLLGESDEALTEIDRRIRVVQIANRPSSPRHFEAVNSAVLRRRRLVIMHHNRERDEVIEREVSPQRLVHYRDNWYMDAWCHWRRGLRSFALDAVRKVTSLESRAMDLPEERLEEELGSGYGIFAGATTKVARIRFSPERARWVTGEMWHPQQKGRLQADGSYLLDLPFSDERELLMDVLRHGAHAEVLAPADLRAAAVNQLRRALEVYGGDNEPAA